MKELVILVADGQMDAVFKAFFSREDWHQQFGCKRIDIWPQEDIIFNPLKARGNDGGVFARSQHILNTYRATHRRAMVILDQQFGDERAAENVRRVMRERLEPSWGDNREVVVIDPELEVWLWQDHPAVNRALEFGDQSIRAELQERGKWPAEAAKPNAPKELLQEIIKGQDLKILVTYQLIARAVPVAGCRDGAFLMFKQRMQEWFPPEVQA